MREILVFLLALCVISGCEGEPEIGPRGQRLPTDAEASSQAACGEDCVVFETAFDWVLQETGTAPADVLLERERGADRLSGTGAGDALSELAAARGINVRSRGKGVECKDERLLESPPEPRCRLHGGELLLRVTLHSAGQHHRVLHVSYIESATDENPISGVYASTYELVLAPEGEGWTVQAARLIAAS